MASRGDSAAGDPDDSKPSGSGKPRKRRTNKPKKALASEAEGLTAALPGPQEGPSCHQSQDHTDLSPAKGATRRVYPPAESRSGTGARALQALRGFPCASSGRPNVVYDLSAIPPRLVRVPIIKETSSSPECCSVLGCPSNENDTTRGLWLFALPCQQAEPSLRAAWMERVPIDLEANGPHGPYVCFRHFATNDVIYRGHRPIGISDGVTPSVPVPAKENVELDYIPGNPRRNKPGAALGAASTEELAAQSGATSAMQSASAASPLTSPEAASEALTSSACNYAMVSSQAYKSAGHEAALSEPTVDTHVSKSAHEVTPAMYSTSKMAGASSSWASSGSGEGEQGMPFYPSMGAADLSHRRHPFAQQPHIAPGQRQAPAGVLSTSTRGATSVDSTSKASPSASSEAGDGVKVVPCDAFSGHYHIEKTFLEVEGCDDRAISYKVTWVPN